MASVCFADRGDCLCDLGRLDQAAAAYEESIRRAEKLCDARPVAVGKGQLGTVRSEQRRYNEALAAHEEARELFTRLDEPGTVAVSLASDGYGLCRRRNSPKRRRMPIVNRSRSRCGSEILPARRGTLSAIGKSCIPMSSVGWRKRSHFTVKLRTSMSRFGMQQGKAVVRNNLAGTLRRLRRFDEARQEILRAIECKAQFGHGSQPWTYLGHPCRTSRPTLETLPPPRRRSARPSPATSPTAATAARITTPTAASASP